MKWYKIVGIILGIILFITVNYYGFKYISEQSDHHLAQRSGAINQEGYNANKAGVPAEANPYIRYPNDSYYWLEGWKKANLERSSK